MKGILNISIESITISLPFRHINVELEKSLNFLPFKRLSGLVVALIIGRTVA
jgi:hypothetical protein